MSEHILFAIQGNVATISLNRPEKLNAATGEMSDAIVAAAEECNRNDAVRCVIVTADAAEERAAVEEKRAPLFRKA